MRGKENKPDDVDTNAFMIEAEQQGDKLLQRTGVGNRLPGRDGIETDLALDELG